MKEYARIRRIPKYMFSDLDKIKNKLQKEGREIIDISIGDPDLPTPEFIIRALQEGSEDIVNHRYPPYEGTYEFRKAVADYYKRRFNVDLDMNDEVAALIGSKEGITHLSLALVDEGDMAIVPDPAYPIYNSSIFLAGGIPCITPLTADNHFIPDLSIIDKNTAKKIKLMYINYPNNPTGAVSSLDSLKYIIEFARENEIIVCNDAAYNEIVFDNNKPVSILNIDGAKDVAVELCSLSKSYNMTGWRIGYAVGNKEVLKKLMVIKMNTDSGQFGAIQHAASAALNHGDHHIEYMKRLYKKRRDTVLSALRECGIEATIPEGSIYIWFKIPHKMRSEEYAAELIKKFGIIVTPGTAFGIFGEGYCRIALTVDEMTLKNAVRRMKKV